MDFRFTYRVRPENLWIVSMYAIYKSMAGLVNAIFTISMVLLAIRFWSETSLLLKCLISAGILLFPILQPLFIFLKSRKLVSRMPEAMEMTINADGLMITTDGNRSRVDFQEMKSILRIRGMLILYTMSGQAYILSKKTIAGKEQALYDFLSKAMDKN